MNGEGGVKFYRNIFRTSFKLFFKKNISLKKLKFVKLSPGSEDSNLFQSCLFDFTLPGDVSTQIWAFLAQ